MLMLKGFFMSMLTVFHGTIHASVEGVLDGIHACVERVFHGTIHVHVESFSWENSCLC